MAGHRNESPADVDSFGSSGRFPPRLAHLLVFLRRVLLRRRCTDNGLFSC